MAATPQSWLDFQAKLKKQHAGETTFNPLGDRARAGRRPTPPIMAAGRGPVANNGGAYRPLSSPNIPASPSYSSNYNTRGNPGLMGSQTTDTPKDPTGFVFGAQAPNLDSFLSASSATSAAPGYANQIAELDRRKKEALQQILFGSQDLSKTLGQSRTDLDARYAQGIAEQAAAVKAAQDAIQQGQVQTNTGNAELAKNLGIEIDQSNVAKDAANAQGSLASQAAAADTRLRGDQLSQYTLGTRNMDVANARGREDQASSQNNFNSAIAQLLDQQQQATAAASNQGYSRFQDAQQQYNSDRDFAYRQWLEQHQEDRQDVQSQLDWEHQLQQAQMQGGDPTAYDQLLASLQFKGSPQPFVDRINKFNSKDPNSFGQQFGNLSNSNQAAFRQYLKQMGLLS